MLLFCGNSFVALLDYSLQLFDVTCFEFIVLNGFWSKFKMMTLLCSLETMVCNYAR